MASGGTGTAGTTDVRVDRVEEGLGGRATTTNTLARASLTTALTGSNNDLQFWAKAEGAVGNNVTINYTDPGGATATLGVVVTGSAIVVNLGRAGSAITTTSALLKAAVDASAAASALVDVKHAAGNDGTGLVIALATTPLAGGSGAYERVSFDAGKPAGFTRERVAAVIDTSGTSYNTPDVDIKRGLSSAW